MSTETIDVVINPGTGARQVIRDINDIASAARTAGTNLQSLQQSINSLGNSSGLSRFQTQLNSVNAQLQQMNQQMNQMGTGLSRIGSSGATSGLSGLEAALRGVMAVLSIKQVMDWADAWNSARGKIAALSPTLQDTNVAMQKLFDIAQSTRAPIDKLAQLYHLMTISAKDLGASQEDILRVTETVSKSLAVQGTSFSQARGAILQLAQSFGTGRVRAQEFNSMMQNMPLLLNLVARNIDGVGGSTQKLRALMLSGKLSSDEFFNALLKAGAQIDEMYKSAPKTFSQAFTVLNNAIEQYVGNVTQATGISQGFFNAMEAVAKNMDNTVKSLLLVGATLIALPFGPIGVAIVAATTAMALFGDKILVGIDNTTTLKDVAGVAFDDMKTRMSAVQQVIADFGQKYLPQLQISMGTTFSGNTLVDWGRSASAVFDTIIQAGAGAVEGIKAAFMTLPTVIDEVGKMMFNSLVTRIQGSINFIIEGINKISSFTGQDMLKPIDIEKAIVDPEKLKKAGADIGAAVAAGMKAAGNPIAQNLEDVLARAGKISADRFHDEFRKAELQSQNNLATRPPKTATAVTDSGAAARAARDQLAELNNLFAAYKQNAQEMTDLEHHKEVMLKAEYDSGLMNFQQYSDQLESLQSEDYDAQKKALEDTITKLESQQQRVQQALAGKKGATSQEQANELEQYRIKVQELTAALEKLNMKEEERIATQQAAKLKPYNDFVTNMDTQLRQMDQALAQDREKLQIQGQINTMSEKDYEIQQGIVQLTEPYLRKLNEVQAKMEEMRSKGLFNPDNAADVNAMNQMQAEVEKIKQIILSIPATMGPALAQAFDAKKIASFSKDLREGIADALATGVFEGGKKGGEQLRDFLKKMLLETPFKMIISALIKPVTDALAAGIGSVVNGVIGSATSSIAGLFGGGGGSSALGSIGSALGIGGGAAASGAFESGFVGTAAVSGAAGTGAGIMGAIGTALPWVGLAAGAIALLGGKLFGGGGGPKQGGYAGVTSASSNPIGISDQHDASLLETLNGTVAQLNNNFAQIAALTGRPAAQFGIGVSTDPAGSAPSFLEVNARDPSGNLLFSKGSTEIGRGADAMNQAIKQFTDEAIQGAMAANGITQAMIDQATAAQQAAAAATAQGDASTNSAAAAQQAAAAAAAAGASQEQQAAAAAAAAQQAAANAALVMQLNQSLSGMGVAAGNLAFASDSAKLAVINFAGGIQNLQAGMQAYFQNFFTEEEQRQALIQQVNATLAGAGVALDAATATRDQFKAIVNSLDLTTAAGQQAYAAMMNVAGAFAQLTDNSKQLAAQAAAEAQAKAEAEQAAMRAEQERMHQEEMAALERQRQEAEAARQQAAWEAEQERLKQEREAEQQREAAAYDKLRSENLSKLQAAYEKEKSDIDAIISSTEQFGNTLKDFQRSLKTSTDSPYTPMQRYTNAKDQYTKDLVDLESPDMKVRQAAQDRFTNDAKTFLDASKTVYASSSQYQKDYAQVQSDVAKAIAINDINHTIAEQQLTALNKSVETLIDINGGVLSVAEALRNFGIGQAFDAWDPNRRYMPGDTASYGGIDYTAGDASAGVFNINSRPDWTPNLWTPNAPIQSQQSVAQWDPHRHYMPGERVMDVDGHMYQASDLSASLWNENSGPLVSPQFWNQVPGHAAGLSYVPRDNYVFRAHYGEAVLSATEANNYRAHQSGMDLTPLLQALAGLREELAELREQHAHGVQADLAAQEKASRDISDRIVNGVGNSQERVAFRTQQRNKATVK